jgi:LmbE family N-acetylglucosaminyl deacetylase
MQLHNSTADVFVPDGQPLAQALARTTHLGIGAHQDDLEFMAFHGIETCFGQAESWFTGVTCTNGAGSSRTGIYAQYTDLQMQEVRRAEQRKAAVIGRYGAMIQLDYGSSAIKDPNRPSLRKDLLQILAACQPKMVYTHNLADKHDTHVAVAVATIQALRALPKASRPAQVCGCEIWRDLDWMPDARKVLLNVSRRENLAAALSGVFDSQISGGKRYDLAVAGRRQANATFLESHGVDQATQLTFAMDLTPLVEDDARDILDYALSFVEEFKADITARIKSKLAAK